MAHGTAGLTFCLSRQRRDASDQPAVVDRWRRRQPGADANKSTTARAAAARRPRSNLRTVANEIVAEIDGSLSDAQADELARRHGLARLQSQNFPLIGATIGLFRITDRRSVEAASREFATEAGVRSVQPNFRYVAAGPENGIDRGRSGAIRAGETSICRRRTSWPHGANVTVAVIDSGIDVKHPELANSIVGRLRCARQQAKVRMSMAPASPARSWRMRRLMGSAPAAQILAIRAFGVRAKRRRKHVVRDPEGFDYAAAHGAQIVNMSFAGPKDALIERGIAALAAKGIVMVAAAGNAGPKSPPLYPAANANVIAVSATDAQDRLFAASNRGSYIAVAAPGVDIFLPAPDEKYQITSGTSFSAAFVSGLAALLLERNPALKPDEVRAILMKTARDLGAPGRDDLFGAGEADAYAAVSAVAPAPSLPVAASDQAATVENRGAASARSKALGSEGLAAGG